MAVTELALVRLQPSTSITDPSLRQNLALARSAMESAAGATFYYYQCIEDPALLYIIGSWPSVSAHMDTFVPGAANQRLLALLKDQIVVEFLLHVALDQDVTPLTQIVGSPVVAIGRLFVSSAEKRRGLESTFGANRRYLDDFVGGSGKVVTGWRVDIEADSEREEFVMFTGWARVEDHVEEFPKTEGFAKYGQIREFLDGAEIKHATLLDVET